MVIFVWWKPSTASLFFMLVNQKKFGEWALTPWNSHQWIARLLFSSFCLMTHSEPLLCCTQDRQRQWKAKPKWVGETLSLVIVFIFSRSRPLPQVLASRGSGLPGGIRDFILSIEQVVIFCAALPLFNEVSAKIHQLGITSHFTVNAAAVARKCSRCGKKDLFFFFFPPSWRVQCCRDVKPADRSLPVWHTQWRKKRGHIS